MSNELVLFHMAGGGVVLQAIFSLVDAFGWHHFTVPPQSALTGLLTALYAFYVRSQVTPTNG